MCAINVCLLRAFPLSCHRCAICEVPIIPASSGPPADDGEGPGTTSDHARVGAMAGRNRISRLGCPGSEVIASATETQEGRILAGLTRLARSRAPLHIQLGTLRKSPAGERGTVYSAQEKAPLHPLRPTCAELALACTMPG